MARVAPELSPALDEASPTDMAVDTGHLVTAATQRVDALADVGIGLLLPSWWTRRSRLGLRANAKPAATAKGVDDTGRSRSRQHPGVHVGGRPRRAPLDEG